MARRYVDCREFPGSTCSVALSADSEEELLDVALQHGIKSHGFSDNEEFRSQIRAAIREGHPRT